MKFLKYVTLALLFTMASAFAQGTSYKVVFDLTSGDKQNWESLLNNIENVRKDLGKETEVAVVAHGGGISFLLKKSSFQVDRMLTLSKQGVKFLGCENTMRRKKISRAELYEFAETVPAGLADIVRKQKEGWAYIKIGH